MWRPAGWGGGGDGRGRGRDALRPTALTDCIPAGAGPGRAYIVPANQQEHARITRCNAAAHDPHVHGWLGGGLGSKHAGAAQPAAQRRFALRWRRPLRRRRRLNSSPCGSVVKPASLAAFWYFARGPLPPLKLSLPPRSLFPVGPRGLSTARLHRGNTQVSGQLIMVEFKLLDPAVAQRSGGAKLLLVVGGLVTLLVLLLHAAGSFGGGGSPSQVQLRSTPVAGGGALRAACPVCAACPPAPKTPVLPPPPAPAPRLRTAAPLATPGNSSDTARLLVPGVAPALAAELRTNNVTAALVVGCKLNDTVSKVSRRPCCIAALLPGSRPRCLAAVVRRAAHGTLAHAAAHSAGHRRRGHRCHVRQQLLRRRARLQAAAARRAAQRRDRVAAAVRRRARGGHGAAARAAARGGARGRRVRDDHRRRRPQQLGVARRARAPRGLAQPRAEADLCAADVRIPRRLQQDLLPETVERRWRRQRRGLDACVHGCAASPAWDRMGPQGRVPHACMPATALQSAAAAPARTCHRACNRACSRMFEYSNRCHPSPCLQPRCASCCQTSSSATTSAPCLTAAAAGARREAISCRSAFETRD